MSGIPRSDRAKARPGVLILQHCAYFFSSIGLRLIGLQVFFCSPKGTPPPRFRETEEADFLVSHLRLHVLSGLREREMNMSTILGDVEYVNGTKTVEGEERWVLRDDANSLGEWQRESAVEHWEGACVPRPDDVGLIIAVVQLCGRCYPIYFGRHIEGVLRVLGRIIRRGRAGTETAAVTQKFTTGIFSKAP